jgi:hypothetical protein
MPALSEQNQSRSEHEALQAQFFQLIVNALDAQALRADEGNIVRCVARQSTTIRTRTA